MKPSHPIVFGFSLCMLCCKAVSCSRPRSRGHDLLLVGRLPPPSLAGTPQQALGERSAAVAVGVACGATRVLWRAAAAHGQGKRALRPPRVCWVVRLPSALDSSSAVVAGPSVAGGEGGWAVGRVSVLLLRWLAILRRSMAILLVVAPVLLLRGRVLGALVSAGPVGCRPLGLLLRGGGGRHILCGLLAPFLGRELVTGRVLW
mmetsp:Transcript_36407/g.108047  ORF Transcript_36407/g.108047 Transcript_36407/m.108047 type:complete len:203 (-) Transcript_36407:1149-1757(-)